MTSGVLVSIVKDSKTSIECGADAAATCGTLPACWAGVCVAHAEA